MVKLVVSEKPSVGMALAAVLGARERKDGCMVGGGYIVSWCVGHLVELAAADSYDEKYSKWRQEKSIAPPKLYDLTTLQREANRLFGYTAQQTLDYAQELYEQKLITYPRTDSHFLTEDMGETASVLIH